MGIEGQTNLQDSHSQNLINSQPTGLHVSESYYNILLSREVRQMITHPKPLYTPNFPHSNISFLSVSYYCASLIFNNESCHFLRP
jgi:hypothetical protein